ncbi:hypothetical protein MRX96_010143 [Rhipicephalus microplus]
MAASAVTRLPSGPLQTGLAAMQVGSPFPERRRAGHRTASPSGRRCSRGDDNCAIVNRSSCFRRSGERALRRSKSSLIVAIVRRVEGRKRTRRKACCY